MNLTLIIMAAGIGSRYGGVKQLDEVGPTGETLMDYSIYDAIKAGFNKVVFIIRRELEPAFLEHYRHRFRNKVEIAYSFQDEFKKHEEGFSITRTKPWGTGHAMLSASDLVSTPFAILNADDFYGASAFKTIASALNDNKDPRQYFLAAYRLINTLSEYGSVSRGLCRLDNFDYLEDVKELTKISRSGNEILYEENGKMTLLNPDELVSMNFWGFTPQVFDELDSNFRDFIQHNYANPKGEFYIPSFVDGQIKAGKARVKVLTAEETWMGVTYREDRPVVLEKINSMVARGIYPPSLS